MKPGSASRIQGTQPVHKILPIDPGLLSPFIPPRIVPDSASALHRVFRRLCGLKGFIVQKAGRAEGNFQYGHQFLRGVSGRLYADEHDLHRGWSVPPRLGHTDDGPVLEHITCGRPERARLCFGKTLSSRQHKPAWNASGPLFSWILLPWRPSRTPSSQCLETLGRNILRGQG